MEWKSNKTHGELETAEVQAMCGAAYTVNANYNLFKICEEEEEPSPEKTMVFTIDLDSGMAHLRVHWRHVTDKGEVCIESDRYVKSNRTHTPNDSQRCSF